jgi:hypothetical protein
MKASDILTDQSKWTQGAFARDEHGEMRRPDDDRASRWCILGALRRAYGDTDALGHAIWAISQVIPSLDGDSISGYDVAAWNDEPERTFDEVRKFIELADV